MKAPLMDTEGKKIGDIELEAKLFGVTPNPYAIHQVVRLEMALSRAGTASTRTRSEVRGGGAKPWRQKGTGRARAGSTRSPLWRGGGTVHGPKPRDYSFRVPRKVRRLAFKSALSEAARNNRIIVLEDFYLERPSTHVAVEILSKLKLTGSTMVVVSEDDESVEKSFRNIKDVEAFFPEELNTYDILRFGNILFLKGALSSLVGDGDSEGPA
ncbi:MAG: 50S ribosomal protein L4 [Actinomycetota bacterium]|nr:50S ribosomal protein L4 [Actinomycetota bacterium]